MNLGMGDARSRLRFSPNRIYRDPPADRSAQGGGEAYFLAPRRRHERRLPDFNDSHKNQISKSRCPPEYGQEVSTARSSNAIYFS